MVSFYGDYDTTETVVIPFNTFTSDDPSASVTMTDLIATDVEIYKDGSLTQRNSATHSGIAVDIDVDTVVGTHWVTIDLSDNDDAGFYVAGSRYQVMIVGTTIDGATVNAWIGAFSIGCTLRPTTAGRTLDVSATGEAGLDFDNVKAATAPTTLTNITVPTVTTATTATTVTNLGNAAQQDVARTVHGQTTWYVKKAGGAGGGTSPDDTVDEINNALTLAAAGDHIKVLDGTYTTTASVTGKAGITIEGSGWNTLLQVAGTALHGADQLTLRNFRISGTGASGVGVNADGDTDVTLDHMHVSGYFDGIYAPNSTRLKLINGTYVFGNYDGINLSSATDWWISGNSIVEIDGSYQIIGSYVPNHCLKGASVGAGTMVGGALICRCSEAGCDQPRALIGLETAADLVHFDAVKLIAIMSAGNATAGISVTSDVDANAGSTGELLFTNCQTYTLQAGAGYEYNFWQASGSLAVDGNTLYDTTKTSGTITVLPLQAVQTYGDANWATATGFSTHAAADVVTALGTGSTLTACLTATGFSTHSAADVWTSVTRTLTAFSFTAAANVTQIGGVAQRATDLAEIAQYLFANSATLATVIADNSVMARLMATNGTITNYTSTTDSQEAIRDLIAGATIAGALAGNTTHLTDIKGTGFVKATHSLVEILTDVTGLNGATMRGTDNASTLDAAGVRSAVGLASANLDTQLADIPTVAEFNARTLVAASYSTLDAAGVRSAVGLASANIDTQLGDIPTVTEFNARSLLAADYFVVGDYTVPPTVGQIQAEMEENGASILDTLQDRLTVTVGNVYHAEIYLTVDGTNSQDEYTIIWFKDGVPITSGITLPTIQVVKRSDGTDLIAARTPNAGEVGSLEIWKDNATTTERLTAGEAGIAVVTATIDGSSRTWRQVVGRDSSA